ncbi:MAG: beta-lactamase family protein, partial [Acidimicrobiales bacterium]|nr:beta-lactamase family protein [Acidimicrobiales bacterium]
HVPELDDGTNDDVLVHHLLTHTAGWESELLTGRIAAMLASGELPPLPPDRDPFTGMFLAMAYDPVRFCAAGEEMTYANVNYELLAEIVRRTTGGTFDAAVRERVLDPLGMHRSAVQLADEHLPHLVTRDPDLPMGANSMPSVDGDLWRASDSGAAGLFSSPGDLARFAQAILDGGTLDGRRILAPSTVRAMTANQIPGTPARWNTEVPVPEASWGYGFSIVCEQRWHWLGGGLVPFGAATHPGAGGINYWIDPTHGIVGVWFEVITEMSADLEPVSGISHRFQDVVTGAVVGP